MDRYHFDRYIADLAKEIVVAKMGNSTITTNDETGYMVGDFYNAIFNSIHAELSKTKLLDKSE